MDERYSIESFLGELPSDDVRNAAVRLLGVALHYGADLRWEPSGVSIRMRASLSNFPVAVVWLCPPSAPPDEDLERIKRFSFGASVFEGYGLSPSTPLYQFLDQWAAQFAGFGFEDVSGDGVKAWAVDYDEAVQHIDMLSDKLAAALFRLRML